MNKIAFVYEEIDGTYSEEYLWGEKIENNLYKIDSIPFFIKNIACGDIVSVEKNQEKLLFVSLYKESGHSTVQIIFLSDEKVEQIINGIENLGCDWEKLKNTLYYTVDIPKEVNYNLVKKLLLTNEDYLDYRESCLSHVD